MSAIIQVWSAPSCQAGAVCFGALAPWVTAAGSEATGTPASFRVTVSRDVADRASIAEGRCLRVLSQGRGEQWFFVSSVSDSDGDGALVQVTAGPLRQLLTVRGLVRSGSTFSFTTGKQTVASLLSTYVLTNLSDDGLAWLSLGTVDFTDTLEIGTLERTTRAGVLDAIESGTGHVARLRGLFSAGVLTGFALDVIADPAAGLETVTLEGAVGQLQRTRDALRAVTVAVPFSSTGAPMEQTAWVVDSTSGTAPAWVVLRDAVTGNPWPIRENGQAVGAILQQRDGTQSTITDSRSSDGAVQVAAVGTIVAGDEVTIVRDAAGRAPFEVTSPAGLASSRGRLVGTVSTSAAEWRRNLVRNGVASDWVSANQPRYWNPAGTSSGNVKGSRYPRNANTTDTTAAFFGTSTAAFTAGLSYTSLAYTGATPGMVVLAGEVVRFAYDGGQPINITVAPTIGIHVVDGTGAGTLTVNSFTAPVGYAAGRPIRMETNLRPVSLPDDGMTLADAMYLTGTVNSFPPIASNARLQNDPLLVRYLPERPVLRAAVGFSMRARGSSGTTGAGVAIIDTVTGAPNGTVLATGTTAATWSGDATIHETATCAATLSSNRTVALCVYAGAIATFVRWASLWTDSSASNTAMGAQNGSGSNVLWHRAQNVLASAASGTRFVFRGLDLVRLVQENGALALNQLVRVRNDVLGIDVTVRVVKLDYTFEQTETLNLELGAVVPRLSGVTVSL